MAIITDNFATALAESLVNSSKFTSMRFGSGDGVVDVNNNVSGLFMDQHNELFTAAGNSVSVSRTVDVLDITFSVTMDTTEGNGTTYVLYNENGLFDSAGTKLTHLVHSRPVRKDSYASIQLDYTLHMGHI